MKRTFLFFMRLAAVLLLLGATGCEKEDVASQQSIVGIWVNVTGNEEHVPVKTDDSIEFLSDGTIVYHDDLLTFAARPSRYEVEGRFLYMYYANSSDKEDAADIFFYDLSDDFNRLELNNLLSSSSYPNVYKRLK